MKTRLLWLGIVVLAGLLIGRAERFVDPDFWWQLAGGKLILTLGKIPWHDPFSYVRTLPVWLNHEWLWEIGAYLLFSRAGPASLIVAKTLITAWVLGFCFWKGSARVRDGAAPTAFLILLTSFAFYYGTSARPQLVSFIFCALWLSWLPRLPERRSLWAAFPATAILWANVHAFIPVGLGLIFLFALGTGCQNGWHKARPYFKLFLLTGAVTLINPYGPGLWWLCARAITFERSHASEALSVFFHWHSSWPYFLLLIICLVSLALSREKRNLAEMLVLTLTASYAARYSRLSPVFAIASWLYLPSHWTSLLDRLTEGKIPVKRLVAIPAFLALFYGMVTLLWNIDHDVFRWNWKMKIAFVSDRLHTGFPVNLVQQMRREEITGNIATPFVWGGYLIWNLADRCRVSFDGRYETVYPAEVCRENLAFENGGEKWDTVLNKYPTDYALVVRGSVTESRMNNHPNWQRHIEDKEAILFRKIS